MIDATVPITGQNTVQTTVISTRSAVKKLPETHRPVFWARLLDSGTTCEKRPGARTARFT